MKIHKTAAILFSMLLLSLAAFAVFMAVSASDLRSQNAYLEAALEGVRRENLTADERQSDAVSAHSASLEEAQEEIARLERVVEQHENTIYDLRNPQRHYWGSQYVRLNDGRYLRYTRPSLRFTGRWVEYIQILDSLEGRPPDMLYTTIFDDRWNPHEHAAWSEAASVPSISPCSNLVAFVPRPGGPEVFNPIVVYDIRTDETQFIELPDLGSSQVFYAAWLDEYTMLVLIGPFERSRPYVYSIINESLTSLDIPIPMNGRIVSVKTVGEYLHMDILHTEPENLARRLFYIYPHAIPLSEIHRLIAEEELRETPEINP